MQPPDAEAELRAICAGLPEAVEESAWIGTRWRIRMLDADTDWDEVAELVTESYCVLAPKTLAALVCR